MKRKIEDYKNKLVAIFCSSIEEWNKINDLLGKKGLTRDYGDISAPDNTFVDCIHINGIGTASKKYYEQQTYAIHLASDFLEKESKFEEGRWYKNYNPPNYMKCDRIDSNYMYGGEYISNGIYNKHSNSMYSWDLKTQTLVTDLEEIQEFLPLNHPDKIVKLTSFPLEGYVYDDVNNLDNLSKYLVNRPFNTPNNNTVKKNAVGIAWNTTSCWWLKTKTSGKKNYKLSDLESFLPKTEIIPEYVEYIDTKYKGQIVKVEEWTSHSFCCIRFENGQREQPFKHLVKSSTKDAYEAQNKPKQLTVDDLIEGEVYFCKNCSFENGNSGYIFLKIGNDSIKHIAIGNKDYSQTGWNFWTAVSSFDLRQATSEEKKWLNICIKWSKFIPEEDLHLYDESGLLIKKEEAMFKKNDYIVVLYNDNSLNSWTNQCFKQLEDLYYLKVVKNLNGNTDGWSVINFKNQSKWRYASSAEILEYERIGKPFDVTTLIKKEKSLVKQVQEGLKLKGRWLKCIKQCDWNTINVGEYIQILENNSLVPYVEWKDNEEGHCIDLGRIDKKEFELMPEGFSPNEKEWIPKVGDWVFGKNLGTSDYNKCKHPVKIIEIKEDRFKYDLLSNPKTDYPRNKSCFYYLSTIVRKATEQDIAMHLGSIIHNQYPLTPIESFQLSIYDLKDIYIAPIIKKETKIQTITIESTTDLNLNLTKIKSKQIQTIKI